MIELLGLVLVSFAVTSFFMVPFIDLLFYLRSRYKRSIPKGYDDSHTPITNRLLRGKDVATPVGGGILLIIVITVLGTAYAYFKNLVDPKDLYIIFFTFITFGLIGFLDDIKKIFVAFSGKYVGIKGRYIILLQIILASLVSLMLYYLIGLNNIYVSGLGNFVIGLWYLPLSVFLIVAFSNALNISDGLDGLSTGLLTVCLFALLALTSATLNLNLAAFIGIWLGSLFAFLYFNVYPARIYLGDAGSLAFGATLAVIGLLTGKILALAIIGGVYVVIVTSSAMQMVSKKFFGRKLFPVAPFHMLLRYIGWEEPKIVMRLILAQALFAIFGLWLALVTR